jgi:DNA-binding CsgD family transcriptional regulator
VRAGTDAALLEREEELDALARRIADAAAGRGGLVLLEGGPGLGKTALVRRVRALGRDRGLHVLQATGGELEREFAFGVVRQLFEPTVLAAAPEERARLLDGAARRAAPLFDVEATVEPTLDPGFATLHGLYWLTAALAEEEPLLVLVDDAHWADAPSLRFLDFLARRAAELPLLLVVALRPSEPGAEHDLLAALGAAPEVATLRPRPLSRDGVQRLVDERLAERAAPELGAEAHAATHGNPLLVGELVRALAERDGPLEPGAVDESVPEAVARSVRRRLAALPPAAREQARALATLGDRSGVPLLGAITGQDPAASAAALGALRDAELVAGEPPAFVHPLVGRAVADGLTAAERDDLHRRAARWLRDHDAPDDEIVVQLLAAPLLGEPWERELLRRSAARALADGAPDAALRRLRRALEIAAEDPELERLRLELGRAAFAAEAPDARHLLSVAAAARDPRIAADATALQIWLGHFGAEDTTARMAERLRAGAAALDREEADQADRWQGRLIDLLLVEVAAAPERARALAAAPDGPRVLSHRAWEAAAGDASGDEVLALGAAALADRPFQRLEVVEHPTPLWAVMALCACDGAALADEALRDADLTLRRESSPLGRGLTAVLRAEWLLAFGGAGAAEASAREATELLERSGSGATSSAAWAALASALVRRGQLEEAEEVLARLGPDERFEAFFGGGSVWSSRAQLRLAQGRPADAVADLRRVATLCDRYGWRRYPRGAKGADLPRALALAGEREEARALADAAVADAARRGIGSDHAIALRALAAAQEGEEAIATLHDAVEVADAAPSPALAAAVRLDLGIALRRAGRRVDARARLAEAREAAHRLGETPLLDRATEELSVAGARPRRIALSGADALTPSERRVAEHAARGLTNRQIAETLFVTRKTVEFQLGATYAKLGISSRTQLAAALEPDGGSAAG